MPSNTPLTDAINALTRYANETTGASDTNLSDAVGTLVAGYGGGGGGYTVDEIASNAEPSGDIVLGNIAVGDYALAYKSAITSLSGDATAVGAFAFHYCSGLKSISFPSMTGQFQQSAAKDCRVLEFADLGSCSQINSLAFQNAMSLTVVVLRGSSVCRLQNANALVNTPIRGYNSGSGTIYVPSALISSYQTTSPWSTIYNEGHLTFAAIEGSQYE